MQRAMRGSRKEITSWLAWSKCGGSVRTENGKCAVVGHLRVSTAAVGVRGLTCTLHDLVLCFTGIYDLAVEALLSRSVKSFLSNLRRSTSRMIKSVLTYFMKTIGGMVTKKKSHWQINLG
jgi:hypothetical protein